MVSKEQVQEYNERLETAREYENGSSILDKLEAGISDEDRTESHGVVLEDGLKILEGENLGCIKYLEAPDEFILELEESGEDPEELEFLYVAGRQRSKQNNWVFEYLGINEEAEKMVTFTNYSIDPSSIEACENPDKFLNNFFPKILRKEANEVLNRGIEAAGISQQVYISE